MLTAKKSRYKSYKERAQPLFFINDAPRTCGPTIIGHLNFMEPKRKNIFFTSDWHIGHASVLVYDKRPFKDLNHMHRVLINNYNACVSTNGICYFLGDVGLTKSDNITKIIKQLNGTKVLILGNHDNNTYSMYEKGFDVVLNTAVFYIADKRISMSHCPLPGIFREDVSGMKNSKEGENWHGEHKNQRFTNQDLTADYHIHGHIHSTPDNEKPKKTDRQFDVGVAANNYRPISISEIESWIALEEQKKTKKLS